jgi:hypothetical protein
MPVISSFYGILIKMYFGDHVPPHFHAEYGEFTAQIRIGDFGIEAGYLPPKALADGTTLKRKVCSAYFEFEGEGGPAPVVYGEEGDEPLLGAITLKSFGLVLNPFTRTLHPMRMLMAKLKP